MKNKVLKELKKNGIVYGKTYTIQAMYLWNHKKGGSFNKEEFELSGYSVCKNEWIKDGSEKHLCPIPIEDYKINEIDKAIDSFIEKEYKK